MQFQYAAYTLERGIIKGRVDAPTAEEARILVAMQGYKPLRISKAPKMPGMEMLFPSLYKVGGKELIQFFRQFATMSAGGGSLLRILEVSQRQSKNKTMKRTLSAIQARLEEGISLSDAMGEHPKIFSKLFVSMVEVGESSGRLAPSLEQMADMLERENEAKQKAIRTLMYPLMIVGLSLVTLVLLMTIALPPLLRVFDSMGTDVPLMTRMAVAGMTWIKDTYLIVGIVLVVVLVLLNLLRRLPRVRFYIDVVVIKMPILGVLSIGKELARFSRTMTTLLDAGVPLTNALQLSLNSSKNSVVRRAFEDGYEAINNGHGLAETFAKHPILPGMFVELVAMGEESNALKRTLLDAALAYEKEVEARLNSLLGLIEPASTLVVGGIVGFIAFSMFVPIYSGLNALK